MKNIKNSKKIGFLKKLFIKICRKLGFEIIAQNTFEIVTSGKKINEDISVIGEKSINLPLGIIKIKRKVKALDIIIRTCSSVNMLTQTKNRIFEKDKIVYTAKTIKSLINSVKYDPQLEKINVQFKVIDHNSSDENLEKISSIFKNSKVKYDLHKLDLSKYEKNIEKINERGEEVSHNQMSNMANINQSLLESKNSNDLVYFVEDDYIHSQKSLGEMIYAYERISSQIDNDLFLCPTDYPYLYARIDDTKIILGNKYHWRKIDQTLCSFFTSKKMVIKYWENLSKMCKFEHQPFEKPLHVGLIGFKELIN